MRRTCSSLVAFVAIGGLLWGAARADEEGRGFRLRVARSLDVRIGTERAVSLTILPKSGYVISQDGPIDVRADPPDGLRVGKRHLRRRDAVDPRAEAPRFELRVRADDAGDYRLPVHVEFWVCRNGSCRPIDRRLEIAVRVPRDVPDAGIAADAGK